MNEKAGKTPERKTPKTQDEKLDQALDQSFPASDPPAQTAPVIHVGAKKKHERKKSEPNGDPAAAG